MPILLMFKCYIASHLFNSFLFASSMALAEDTLQSAWNAKQYGDIIAATEDIVASPLSPTTLRALLLRAKAYRALQRYSAARQLYQTLINNTTVSLQVSDQIQIWREIGNIAVLQHRYAEAEQHLLQAIMMAKQHKDTAWEGKISNDLGKLFIVLEQPKKAAAYFKQSITFAKRTSLPVLEVKSILNYVQVSTRLGNKTALIALLDDAMLLLQALPTTAEKNHYLLNLAKRYSKLEQRFYQYQKNISNTLRQKSYYLYLQVINVAQTMQDNVNLAYAQGYVGELYLQEQRYQEAVYYTQQAILSAQKVPDGYSLYRWHWQLASIYAQQDKVQQALQQYRIAIVQVKQLKNIILLQGNYSQDIQPLWYAFVDILLRYTEQLSNPEQIQAHLQEARELLEMSNITEIEMYINTPCSMLNYNVSLDHLDTHSAIIYPLILADRTVMLVSIKGKLKQYITPIAELSMQMVLQQFRKQVEHYTTQDKYLKTGKQLYQWLLKNIEGDLQTANIDTLVFLPDPAMRQIPFAALYDGKHFLIERYALATTPSLRLIDTTKNQRKSKNTVLAAGLTVAVQGFPALPEVQQELQNIGKYYPVTILQDEQFILDKLQQLLIKKDYDIVHIASHGEFDSYYQNSFLLTYDTLFQIDTLAMTLQQHKVEFQELDLLVLSACQTATGDNRSSLGLAGIAIRSGAKSTLASLWQINDKATAHLIDYFYQQLSKKPQQSKAKALQQAQIQLLTQYPMFKHPADWAAFLLIGNWL